MSSGTTAHSRDGARIGRSVPRARGELAMDRQRIVGDLISYQNDGKGCTGIAARSREHE